MNRRFRINVEVPASYIHRLDQILQITGQSQIQFGRELILNEIDRLSVELLKIEPGSPRAVYHRFYAHWSVAKSLKANGYKQAKNYELLQRVIAEHGEPAIFHAINQYAEILHSPDRYCWCEVKRFEDWIVSDIRYFLPDADPQPQDRYALPRLDADKADLEVALGVELW